MKQGWSKLWFVLIVLRYIWFYGECLWGDYECLYSLETRLIKECNEPRIVEIGYCFGGKSLYRSRPKMTIF